MRFSGTSWNPVFILLNDFTCHETRMHNADWFDCMIALVSIQRYAVYQIFQGLAYLIKFMKEQEVTAMRVETIETKHLYLRGFRKEDARFAVSIWNDPEMGEYLADEAMDEIDEAYLKEIEKLPEDETCCYMIAELKSTRESIGTCSFIPSPDGKTYDIAYCVHKKYWRNGYATEMAGGMVDYAKAHGADKVTVSVNKDNVGSNAVARKIGFQVIGESRYKKRGTESEFSDYLYCLTVKASE